MKQRGQAMLEYALIVGTVTMAFGVAYQLGVSSIFLDRIQDAQSAWNIVIDPNNFNTVLEAPGNFNNQIVLR